MEKNQTSVKAIFSKRNKVEAEFPTGDVAYPTLPEKLVGKKVPPFVLAWLADTEEMGWLIQDMLQAPTRSFCRIYTCISRKYMDESDVTGQAAQKIPEKIEGLPNGISLPDTLLIAIKTAKRIENWIIQGKRVTKWAEENGAGDEPWLS